VGRTNNMGMEPTVHPWLSCDGCGVIPA